jgi:5-methylcytosine-specific restriction endonuclease McrA
MYPVMCKDGREHAFVLDDKPENGEGYSCSVCGTDDQQYINAKTDQERVAKALREFSNIVNGISGSFVSEAMFEEMQRTHRTLQQNFMRTLQGFIHRMTKMDTDLRNEASVAWCKQVDKIDVCLPLI